MRIAFDATPLLDVRTGVGEFVASSLERLAGRDDLDVTAFGFTRRYLAQLTALLPSGVRATRRPIPARATRQAWLRSDHPAIERWTGPIDLVHGPNFVVPPARHAVELVTVHDLTPVRFPELCDANTVQYPTLIRRAVRRGAHIHTVSRFVADEVQDVFGVPAERVHVVPNGVGPVRSGDPVAGRRAAGTARYVLFLGTVEPRKNVPSLVRAFDALAGDHPDVGLVLAGRDGWGVEELEAALGAAAHRDRVVRTGYVDDQRRADLLAGATLLVYPSRYEGFGLPPLEAMAAGTPVVATRAGAVPEVVADGAVLVEPGDDDALAAAIDELLGDDTRRAELVERGRARAGGYDWDRTADGLAALYRALIDRR